MINFLTFSGTVKHDGALFVPFAKPLLQVFDFANFKSNVNSVD